MGALCCKDSAASSGGSAPTSEADRAARRQARAAAAEKRAMDSGGGVQNSERIKRDRLIGKIEALYANKGKDPPFGLRAATVQALERHLETARRL